ncbi:MAG: AAA family ATPase [Luteitalea sp.]|nr:AAA family ATPase [Luteitalea sp.]
MLEFRYLAIEGPPGAGKGTLAERLSARLDAHLVLDETENPFGDDQDSRRPGAAFQSQLFHLLSRHRQQEALRQGDLFSQITVCDYLFDKDKIFAYLKLDDNELFIYQRVYELLARDLPTPDVAIYLQASTEVLRKRVKARARHDPEHRPLRERDLAELNDAFTHFFFHYTATSLLVVETSELDLEWDDETVDDLLKQIENAHAGTRYYVPRTT